MEHTQITLILPQKTDPEFETIAATWIARGGRLHRPGQFWIKDEALAKEPLAIYGSPAFAFVVAQIYGVELLSPDETLLVRLEDRWVKRKVILTQIRLLKEAQFPVFIKPAVPKLFPPGIFNNLTEFNRATANFPEDELILVSTVVDNLTAEARAFILDAEVIDLACYEGSADIKEGIAFLNLFLQDHQSQLPRAVVVDIAYGKDTGWFVLEFNASCGAGLNNCRAEMALDCIVAATINSENKQKPTENN